MTQNVFLHFIVVCLHLQFSSPQGMAQNKEPMTQVKESVIKLKLGKTLVKILLYQKGPDNGELYFNMHDDENTSVLASQKFIEQHGGKLAHLSHSGERIIKFRLDGIEYGIDPNRIFTKVGVEQTLKKYGNYSPEAQKEVEQFAGELIQQLIRGQSFIIAMHNNHNSPSFSIKSYIPGGNYQEEAEEAYYNQKMGTGEFFYTIERHHYEYFHDQKFSVVLQDNSQVSDDGSLSVYCAREGITYINVEAERGHLQEQFQMLEVLQKLLPSYGQ